MINQHKILIVGILLGGLGVTIGAFGAHALKPILVENNRIETFELAVRYQVYHALALITMGILIEKFDSGKILLAVLSTTLGVIIFSGSLYTLSLTNITILGAVTPIGGVLIILGWILFLLSILKKK